MIIEYLFNGLFVFATLTTLLVAGLLFTFALLVMPGLGQLEDRAFLRGFQEIDLIIQRNHPLFITVWLGSMVSLLAVTVLGFGQVEGTGQWTLFSATLLYFLGVQLPTFRGNLPLNNRLQTLDLSAMSDAAVAEARRSFEPRWNRLNVFRTSVSILVSILLIVTHGL